MGGGWPKFVVLSFFLFFFYFPAFLSNVVVRARDVNILILNSPDFVYLRAEYRKIIFDEIRRSYELLFLYYRTREGCFVDIALVFGTKNNISKFAGRVFYTEFRALYLSRAPSILIIRLLIYGHSPTRRGRQHRLRVRVFIPISEHDATRSVRQIDYHYIPVDIQRVLYIHRFTIRAY